MRKYIEASLPVMEGWLEDDPKWKFPPGWVDGWAISHTDGTCPYQLQKDDSDDRFDDDSGAWSFVSFRLQLQILRFETGLASVNEVLTRELKALAFLYMYSRPEYLRIMNYHELNMEKSSEWYKRIID